MRLTGQKRVPEPPAKITAYKFDDRISFFPIDLLYSFFDSPDKVTITSLANVPLDFEASADGRILSGTFERTGGASVGELIAVSVEEVIGQELDMVGAYELITTYTYGDTLGDVYSESLAVRLEFERDGTFRATSRSSARRTCRRTPSAGCALPMEKPPRRSAPMSSMATL